jgi:hypothetical protein
LAEQIQSLVPEADQSVQINELPLTIAGVDAKNDSRNNKHKEEVGIENVCQEDTGHVHSITPVFSMEGESFAYEKVAVPDEDLVVHSLVPPQPEPILIEISSLETEYSSAFTNILAIEEETLEHIDIFNPEGKFFIHLHQTARPKIQIQS